MEISELLNSLGLTMDVIGKVMVSYTVIKVHYRFWQEHKIDEAVFKSMKKEQKAGLIGIFLMILGYVLQILSRL